MSIVSPCFNEEDNVEELYRRISEVMEPSGYDYELIFIDNHSSDRTVERIKAIALRDTRVKLIVNVRNFGHIRSPYHALLQAHGDAVVSIASDLQDPPEMILELLKRWEEGFKTVLATKPESEESKLMLSIRRLYYRLVARISEVPLVQNATGAGLFDKAVIDILRTLDDPYPYFRGLVCEIGFPIALVPFKQPKRTRGVTKNNFYTLYDMAMLGITSHSKVPLRIATIAGFALSLVSLLISLTYLVLKLTFWSRFGFGTAPILIGLFFFSSVQLFFIGLLGEYIASIHTQVLKRPLVVEQERVNFDDGRE